MLIEKTLKEALADYIKGKPVTVLWTRDDGSMDVRLLSDILEQEENHFLVNVPAYHNPEFAQAVAEMVEQNRPENCSAEVAPFPSFASSNAFSLLFSAGITTESGSVRGGGGTGERRKRCCGDRAVDRCKIQYRVFLAESG